MASMDFLAGCQRLRQEADIPGTGPVTTVGQTGKLKNVVDWFLSAYEDIQNLHKRWDFLRADLTFATITNVRDYTKAAINAVECGEWEKESFRVYKTASGVATEQYMRWVPWIEFRDAYMFGANRSATGIPRQFTQKPDGSLVIFPTPVDAYTINAEYFKRAQEMTKNTDQPLIPSEFRMIIVWRALMLYAGQDNAPELYAVGRSEYTRLLRRLESSQLQSPTFSGPLA